MDIKRLREIRESKGLTQVEMANLVGVSLNGYVRWEQGANKPNEENLKKLKKALKEAGKNGRNA